MWESFVVYAGLIVAVFGLVTVVRPVRWLGLATRSRGVRLTAVGLLGAAGGFVLPVGEFRAIGTGTQLDRVAPVWQFHEVHRIRIAAPPTRVFAAIRQVRADEILLFRTLTWIRRGGQPLPDTILDAGERESLIDVAIRGGFVRLADDEPRELVIGTVVMAPPGAPLDLTPALFTRPLPPGFALATMNFLVTPDSSGASWVSTETRVFANSPAARRRFAAYWRVIYPGSAIIRRMWLRAIEQRATSDKPV